MRNQYSWRLRNNHSTSINSSFFVESNILLSLFSGLPRLRLRDFFFEFVIQSRHILAPSRTNGIRIVVVNKMATKFVTNHVAK